jgi:hypothetical protein
MQRLRGIRYFAIAAAAAACFPLFGQNAAAQQSAAPKALIVFAEDPDALEIYDAYGVGRSVSIGDELREGETLRTTRTAAELKLSPNGSILKVARNTSFKIDGLAAASGSGANEFSLLGGKLRVVAARSAASDAYRFRTPSAVCGVRGTDFSLNVIPGFRDQVLVKKGLIDFARLGADGAPLAPIAVAGGQFADALAPAFGAAAFSAAQLAEEYADLEFTALDPASVPDAPVPQAAAEPRPAEAAPAEAAPAAPVPTAPPAEPAAPEAGEAGRSRFGSWLSDVLGFEIGSVVIDGQTYSKAIVQPTFSVGKLRMSFYLPIIYTSDLFDSSTWYRPRGNDEWSFGAGDWGEDDGEAALDALRDAALKIRFIEYGNQALDPAYLKIGNLSSMTIGHGVLMRNFANDADFPAVRRVGVNAGFDLGSFGAEGVVNDLAEPEIFGGRVKLGIFGFTVIADIDPGADLSDEEREAIGDPMLLGSAVDADLPILRGDLVALKAFADVAALAPYTRTDIEGGPEAGLQSDLVYDPDRNDGLESFRNYGLMGGFIGKFAFLDWRLEYRQYRGAYRPTLFNALYERNRSRYALEYAALLSADGIDQAVLHGVYGEAGFRILADKVEFGAGYLLPWTDDSSMTREEVLAEDYLMARVALKRGFLPFYGISASFTYERTGFAYAATTDAKGVTFFDANTVLRSEAVLPIASSVDLAVVVTTAAVRDEDGNVVFRNGKPDVEPSVSLETRIRF